MADQTAALLAQLVVEPPERWSTLLSQLLQRQGLTRRVDIYLVDHSRIELVALDTRVRVRLAGERRAVLDPEAGMIAEGDSWWLPMPTADEVNAVLRCWDAVDGDDSRTQLQSIARVVGTSLEMVRQLSDTIDRERRRKVMSVPAELQWDLLPPTSARLGSIVLGAALEPAYDVAGDLFDYSLDADAASLCVIDAMGHGLKATLLAAGTLSAIRNQRREAGDIVSQAVAADATVTEMTGGSAFVTGLLVSFRDGRWEAVNAGHPPAMRLRDGRVELLELQPDLPFGLGRQDGRQHGYRAQPLDVVAGDRLVLMSDGVVEARPEGGGLWGEESVAEVIRRTGGTSARDAARQLAEGAQAHRAAELVDDVTAICVDVLDQDASRRQQWQLHRSVQRPS